MPIAHILRKLGVAGASALFLLSILGGVLYPQSTAQAASKQGKYDFSQLVGARPIWKYSRPIAAVSGGQLPAWLQPVMTTRCKCGRQYDRVRTDAARS